MISRWIWGRTLENKSCLFGEFASSIGFYLILSIAPFLAVVIALSHFFFHVDLTLPSTKILQSILPPDSRVNVSSMVSNVNQAIGGGVLTITFIFALITTQSFMHSLVRALRYIFSTEQLLPKTTVFSTFISLTLIALWGFVFALFSMFLLLAPAIELRLNHLDYLSHTAIWIWNITRYTVTFLFIWIAIYLTYQLTDANRHPVGLRIQSSLLASLAWLCLGYAFTHIFPLLWSASLLHGALGGLVAMLIWANATAWVLLLGACLVVRRSKG